MKLLKRETLIETPDGIKDIVVKLLGYRSKKLKKTLFIFCLLMIMFCLACLHAALKTDQGDNTEKDSIEVQELPCEDHTVNAAEDTGQEDTAEKALQAYEEFLDGENSVGDIDILYLTTPTGEPDKRFAIQYVILDSNGDDVPELHTRGREFYVFTYKNDQMNILEGFFSYPTQYTLLTDGKFAHWEERGDPLWNYFSCFRLDNDGNKIDRINFWWTDANENCVRDEEDEYIFDDRESTMEEWI